MKWGILATGNIAKKFASTINHVTLKMQKPLLMSMISQDIMIRMKHWLKIRMLRLFM